MTKCTDDKMGVISCTIVLIGAMVGSAIFSLSGITMVDAGPAAILTWIIAGLIMLIYGLFMAELSVRYPESGGVYIFPRKAFSGNTGIHLGWISCWSSIVTNIISIAFAGIYVGIYLSVAFPFMGNYQIPIAIIAILFSLFLNCIRFSTAGRIHNTFTAILIIMLLIYVIISLSCGSFKTANFSPFFTQGTKGSLGFFSAISVGIIGYSAITAIANMVSEVRNPEKTVPRSMVIAISLTILLYALVIFATLGLITITYLINNPDMQYIPLFAACFTKLYALPWLSTVISIAAVIALMTTMNICTAMNARFLKVAAEDNILPEFLKRNNRFHVPAAAAAICCIIAIVIACFPDFTSEIVNFAAIFNCINLAITICTLIKSRRNIPERTDSFKAPGGTFLPLLILAILIACNISGIFSYGIKLWIFTAILLIIGYLILLLRQSKIKKIGN